MRLPLAHGAAAWLLAPLVAAICMAAAADLLGMAWLAPASLVPFALFLGFLWFFRDPQRAAADGVVSPADGRVVRVDAVDDPDVGRADRLCIFMRVHDVHVNRAPLAGDVRRVTHRPGSKRPAYSKDADANERVETLIRTELGDVKVVQIAGAVARRIVPYTGSGTRMEKGDRLGLIRLGSRCDLIVPAGRLQWQVAVGDRVRAATTTVASQRTPTPPEDAGARAPAGSAKATAPAGEGS